jgi:hypothetical protein
MSEELRKILTEVAEGDTHVINVDKQLLGDKENVSLDFSRKRQMPERMESPARAHTFHDVAGFISYLATNKADDAAMVVLADISSQSAAAVLNDKAEKGFEIITFDPPYHPEFVLLSEMLNKTLDIKDFARQILRNMRVIAGEQAEARNIALMMSQITVSSQVTACTGTGKNSISGVMVTTNVKAGVGESKMEIPDSIKFTLPIYLNTDPETFEMDITVIATRNAETVSIQTDAPELAVIKHKLFEKLLEPVKKMDGVIVSYGMLSTSDWIYNK